MYNGGMQIKAFIQYYWSLFRFATEGAWGFSQLAAAILAFVSGYAVYKHPEWEPNMKDLLWIIPLMIFVLLFAIRLILAPYEKHKEQKEEIEKLKIQHNPTFFESNIDIVIKSLENDIKEINNL